MAEIGETYISRSKGEINLNSSTGEYSNPPLMFQNMNVLSIEI